jgi:hypothetical protein
MFQLQSVVVLHGKNSVGELYAGFRVEKVVNLVKTRLGVPDKFIAEIAVSENKWKEVDDKYELKGGEVLRFR